MSGVLRGLVAVSGVGLTGTIGYVGHSLTNTQKELERVWQQSSVSDTNPVQDADQYLIGMAPQLRDALSSSADDPTSSGLVVLTAGRGEPLHELAHEVLRVTTSLFPMMIDLNCVTSTDVTSEGTELTQTGKAAPSLADNLRWQLSKNLTDSFEKRSAPVPDWLLAVSEAIPSKTDNTLTDSTWTNNIAETVVSFTCSAVQLACSPARLITSQLLQVDNVQRWLFPSLECSLDVINQGIDRLGGQGVNQGKLLLCLSDVIPALAKANTAEDNMTPSEVVIIELAAQQQKAEQERLFAWISDVLQGNTSCTVMVTSTEALAMEVIGANVVRATSQQKEPQPTVPHDELLEAKRIIDDITRSKNNNIQPNLPGETVEQVDPNDPPKPSTVTGKEDTSSVRQIHSMLWVNVPNCTTTRDGKLRLSKVLRHHLLTDAQQDIELPAALFMDEILSYIRTSVGFQTHDIEKYGELLARKLIVEGSFNTETCCLDCEMRELIQAVMSSVDKLTGETNESVSQVFRGIVPDGSSFAASAVWLWDVLSLITGYESHIGGLDSLGKNKKMHLQVRNIPVVPLAHLQGLHASEEEQLRVETVRTLLEWVGVGILDLQSALNETVPAVAMQTGGTPKTDKSTEDDKLETTPAVLRVALVPINGTVAPFDLACQVVDARPIMRRSFEELLHDQVTCGTVHLARQGIYLQQDKVKLEADRERVLQKRFELQRTVKAVRQHVNDMEDEMSESERAVVELELIRLDGIISIEEASVDRRTVSLYGDDPALHPTRIE